MTFIQSANTISTLVLSYLIIKLVRKILNNENRDESENSLQFLGCEAHIRYIEAENKFNATNERNHATISKIEGKLKSGKRTIESKIEGKWKSKNYMTTNKFLEKSIIRTKFSRRDWLGHDGSEQRKILSHWLLTRSEGVLENKEKTLLKSRDICLVDHENKDSFESSVVCKAKHELMKQFLIGSKGEETYMTIKQIEEDQNNKEVITEEFGGAVLQLQNQINKESERELPKRSFARRNPTKVNKIKIFLQRNLPKSFKRFN